MLIFEGVDASGKDTTMEALNKHLDYEIIRGSSFELTGGKDEFELYEAFDSLTGLDNVILNRYIYSNMVYAPLFDDYSRLNSSDAELIESKIKDKATIIYLYADKEVIAERFRSRGEEYVDESQIESILESYRQLLLNTELDVIMIDTGKFSTAEAVDTILTMLELN